VRLAAVELDLALEIGPVVQHADVVLIRSAGLQQVVVVRFPFQVVDHHRGAAVVEIAQAAGPRVAFGVDGELVLAELAHVQPVLWMCRHVQDVGPVLVLRRVY